MRRLSVLGICLALSILFVSAKQEERKPQQSEAGSLSAVIGELYVTEIIGFDTFSSVSSNLIPTHVHFDLMNIYPASSQDKRNKSIRLSISSNESGAYTGALLDVEVIDKFVKAIENLVEIAPRWLADAERKDMTSEAVFSQGDIVVGLIQDRSPEPSKIKGEVNWVVRQRAYISPKGIGGEKSYIAVGDLPKLKDMTVRAAQQLKNWNVKF